ncbi:hypothetical protein [Floricoccus penangensis]|uniref:hypothetical protein n=1 Tax=Floricoccus penangensis TaxID=1859475 RepID=UPI00203B69EE|nr:hypothetical protein [Floricoccus penangensis]URZ87583.1 hypothetical protein KIW23_00600 [Floricoccus penangensis]
MKIKRFQNLSWFLSLIFKLMIFVAIGMIVLLIYDLIFGPIDGMIFSTINSGFISFSKSNGNIDNQERIAAEIVTIIIALLNIYIYNQASKLFNGLSGGETPFNQYFSGKIRTFGYLYIAQALLSKPLYSIILSVLIPNGYKVVIGFGEGLLIGLILLIASAVLDYGTELQYISDETV